MGKYFFKINPPVGNQNIHVVIIILYFQQNQLLNATDGGKNDKKNIRIDKEKCNGCGACADACHEGAIDIINGKAELVREHFCDGLGDCLPECPTGAISFEEREAPEYDEAAVKEAQKKNICQKSGNNCSCRLSRV